MASALAKLQTGASISAKGFHYLINNDIWLSVAINPGVSRLWISGKHLGTYKPGHYLKCQEVAMFLRVALPHLWCSQDPTVFLSLLPHLVPNLALEKRLKDALTAVENHSHSCTARGFSTAAI